MFLVIHEIIETFVNNGVNIWIKSRQPTVGFSRKGGLCVFMLFVRSSDTRLLGAFAKLRKAIITFMSVRPSVYLEQLGSRWTDIH